MRFFVKKIVIHERRYDPLNFINLQSHTYYLYMHCMLRRPLAGRKSPVIMWSTRTLIWRCSQERKRRGGICRQTFDKNCWLYPGKARRWVPIFLQVFSKLVPTVCVPNPSFSTSLEVQSALATLLRMCRGAACWHCRVCAGNLSSPAHPSAAV